MWLLPSLRILDTRCPYLLGGAIKSQGKVAKTYFIFLINKIHFKNGIENHLNKNSSAGLKFNTRQSK